MIHWGELGRMPDINLDAEDGPPTPFIQPRERPNFMSAPARRSIYNRQPSVTSAAMHGIEDRLAGTRREPAPLTTSHNANTITEGRSTLEDWWTSRSTPTAPSTNNTLRHRYFFGDPYSEDEGEDATDRAKVIDQVGPKPEPPAPIGNSFATHDRYTESLKRNNPVEVAEVNLNIPNNCNQHHTHDYDITERYRNPHLVIRRGQTFELHVRFRRDLDPENDIIVVRFETGNYPRESDGTSIVLPLNGHEADAHRRQFDRVNSNWWAEIAENGRERATLRFNVAVSAIVGVWNLKLYTSLKPKQKPDYFAPTDHFEFIYPIYGVYILFNPWCPEDMVYLPNEEDREEYIMNDVGKIWRGSHNSLKPTYWVYGQFDEYVLKASITILEKSRLAYPMRASAIEITRTISAMINEPDDFGVLVGNWSNDYRGGTPPTEWTGSIDILRKYFTLNRPVSYGQCWVFAGVVTSVCRALGIPSRPVSNYSSAHDTDSSVTVDIHVDRDGKPIKELNHDSIWNFHVWNEVWMKRPDLPAGHSGWQVIDATPQEKSDGVLRLGPCSVEAVKKGELYSSYDTAFVFAEVNADKCYWMTLGDRIKFVQKDTEHVGRMISTKRPGKKLGMFNDDRMDITNNYKYTEGSKAERLAVLSAVFTGGSHAFMAYRGDDLNEDVTVELDLEKAIMIGEDFSIGLTLKNLSFSAKRTAQVSLRIDASLYTGTQGRKIKAEKLTVVLNPNEATKAQMRVSAREYLPRLLDQSAFTVTTLVHVVETLQVFTATDDFRVQMPDIDVAVHGRMAVGKTSTVELSFKNPLPQHLTDCKFLVDAPGISPPINIFCRSVLPHQMVTASTDLTPFKGGERAIVAHFTSDQLQDVDGSTLVKVDGNEF